MQRKKNGLENLVLISQIGINVMTPVFLCLFIGKWLEQKSGIRLLLPLLLLGIFSGAFCTYSLLKHRVDREKEEERSELERKKQQWEQQFGTDDGSGRNKRKGWQPDE